MILATAGWKSALPPTTVKQDVSDYGSDRFPFRRAARRREARRRWQAVVILGSPVWGSRAPRIMSTFLDGVDLGGKTVLPLVTYAVSGMSGIDDCLPPRAEHRDG